MFRRNFEINPRKRKEEKDTIVGIYKDFAKLFAPILESDNEQPDTTDVYDLESEESTDQAGQGLKILTPNQMVSKLPIFLAYLKTGNNSEKFKNEIWQLLYSLY